MRTQLIQYLNNPRDGNALTGFIRAWVIEKCPGVHANRVNDFIDLFLHGLMNVPPMFDPRYQDMLTQLIATAKAELGVNEVQYLNKQHIKFY